MKKLSILSIAVIALFTIVSCNSKKTNSSIQLAEIAGLYSGTGDYESWSCMLDEDGTGMETAVYSNGEEEISVPFKWEVSGDKITFTFDPDNASITNQDEKYAAIVNAAMQGYSEPRECTLTVEGQSVTIDGEGLYPTYKLNTLEGQ